MPPFRVVLLLLGLGQLFSWSAFYYSFTSFVLPMQQSLGWDKATLMGAFSLGLAVWALATYGVGAAIDRGHGRLLMTLGSVLGGIGFLLWSQVTTPWTLYLAWAFIGLAMAMTLYEPAFTILTRSYPTRYKSGITALTLVGGFATTVGFPLVAALLAITDWRTAIMAIGFLLILVVAPAHAFALRGTGTLVHQEVPDGDTRLDSANFSLQQAKSTQAFWLLLATFALYSFSTAALWAHVIPALTAKGLTTAQTLAVLVWVGPAQVSGRILFITFGKRLPAHALGIGVLLGLPISFVIFAMAAHVWHLIAFALLFGAANGLVSIVRGSLLPDYFGRANLGRIGGAMSTAALCARTIAPLTLAWFVLVGGDYRIAMIFLAAIGALAVVLFAIARPPSRIEARPLER